MVAGQAWETCMPIPFTCEHCGKTLKVRDDLAGKRVKCPQCQGIVRVPTPKTDLEAWFLQTEDGETYGPVPRAELDQWTAEGRVTADCQVLLDGSDQWQWATDLYPHLEETEEQPQTTSSRHETSQSPQNKQVADSENSSPNTPTSSVTTGRKAAGSKAAAGKEAMAEDTAGDAARSDQAASPITSNEQAGPFDFAPAETSSTASSGAFDFNASDRGRASTRSRGRGTVAKKGKPTKTKALAPNEPSAEDADAEQVGTKSKTVAAVLAFFLGVFGVHRFYLGYNLLGVAQLLTGGGCGIWALVDFVLILLGKVDRDAQGQLLR